MPIQVRNITKFSVNDFKTELDKVFSRVPDEPNISGSEYTPKTCDQFTGRPSNSLIDHMRGIDFKKKTKAGT